MPESLSLFISYSHLDSTYCDEFAKALSQLVNEGLVQVWRDRRLTAGEDWQGIIDEHLNTSPLIVLLISDNFFASEQCKREMARALERAKEARIISVVLTPTDWEHSPLAKYVVLPKDGKPVDDWPSHQHGFNNAVRELRRIVQGEAEPIRVVGVPVRIRPWHKVVTGTLVSLLALWGTLWWISSGYLAQADDLLNVGRYAEAKAPYQTARLWNPLSARAAMGLRKVDLASIRYSDAVLFETKLNEMLREAPRDSHLKVLEGDDLISQKRYDDAMRRYQEAVKLNPRNAEAYFRLGVLFDQDGDSKQAIDNYKEAVDKGRQSPHYRVNLADQYKKAGNYQAALNEYGSIPQFPLAALESAKIHRLLGQLSQALADNKKAIAWLHAESSPSPPENQAPWSFEISEDEGMRVASNDQKLCYANLEMAATQYLMGNEANHSLSSCEGDLAPIVAWELNRLATPRATAFVKVLQASDPHPPR